MKKINVKAVASYKGHSIRENGKISLSLKLRYDELTNTILMMQMLNNDVAMDVKLAGEKPMKLGTFRINGFSIDGDGESTVKFESLIDYVEMDNINNMVAKEPFQVKLLAVVEEEENDE